MPLTARLRDEENERINRILKQLIALDYVPHYGSDAINEVLKGLAIDQQSLLGMTPETMVAHLQKWKFDWENAEQFADFLMKLSFQLPEDAFALKAKAIAVYNYVQSESKTFSWPIANKIASAKK